MKAVSSRFPSGSGGAVTDSGRSTMPDRGVKLDKAMVRPRRASRRREETGPNAHGVLPVTRRRILYKGGRVVLELLLAEYKGRVYPGHNFIVGMRGSSSGPCSLSESFHDEAAAVGVYRQSAISFVKYQLANSCTPKCDRVSLEKALEKLEEDERNATRGKEGGSRSGRTRGRPSSSEASAPMSRSGKRASRALLYREWCEEVANLLAARKVPLLEQPFIGEAADSHWRLKYDLGRSPAEAVEQYAEACRRDAEAGPTGVAHVVEPQEAP